jgi:hypothetical protein
VVPVYATIVAGVPSPFTGRVREAVLLAERILAVEEIAARPDPHPAPVGATRATK